MIPPSAALDAAVTMASRAARVQSSPPVGRGARWLAVGRVSPNKALESTVAALAVAHAHGDPEATLRVIGKPATESYVAALQRYVAELGLAAAVTFTGHAGDAAVAAAYGDADVLVVTSEHEGFCVPVVEAMSAGLPVVAFDQGAVPEVLGDAGVLVPDKDPYALATVHPRPVGGCAAPRRARRGGTPAAGRSRSRVGRRPLREPAGPLGAPRRGAGMSGVHQFVPMLHRSDAVGRHALALRDVLAARGIASRMYVELADPDTASETRPFAAYEDDAAPGDVLVYQFATASGIASWLQGRPETLVVNYHNVTPPEFYAPWDNAMARHQLARPGRAPRAGPPGRPGSGGVGLQRVRAAAVGSPARRSSRPRRSSTRAGSPVPRGAERRPGPEPAGSAWDGSPRTKGSSWR